MCWSLKTKVLLLITLDGWVTCDVYSSNMKVGNHRSIRLNAEDNPNTLIEVAGLRTFGIHAEFEDFFVQMIDLKFQLMFHRKHRPSVLQRPSS